MKTTYDYTNSRVLVTGAGTGIGRGIALAFARAGAAVALHYSRSADGAAAAVAQIRAAGGSAEAFGADFDDVQAVQRLGQEAVDYLGGLDILVNNAGITDFRPIGETTPEQFDRLYHVNVRAPYFLSQAVLPSGYRGRASLSTSVRSMPLPGCRNIPPTQVRAGLSWPSRGRYPSSWPMRVSAWWVWRRGAW